MVEKVFKCIICEKITINPKSHILIHTLDDIIDCFVNLTFKNETKKEEIGDLGKKIGDLTDWNLNT